MLNFSVKNIKNIHLDEAKAMKTFRNILDDYLEENETLKNKKSKLGIFSVNNELDQIAVYDGDSWRLYYNCKLARNKSASFQLIEGKTGLSVVNIDFEDFREILEYIEVGFDVIS